MRQQILCAVTTGLCLLLIGVASGDDIEIDFANTSGAQLTFNGTNGTFSFTPDTNGHDFQINNVSGGTGSALNLFGTISGTFTIGTILNNEAPVTGSGVLTISDGSQSLTANISMMAIQKPNAAGVLNPNEIVNVSNIHYTGTNQDLSSFAGGLNPTALLTFFDSHTLTQLKSGGQTVNTGFAGNLTSAVVPEPGSMALVLGAIPALGGLWFSRGRRKTAKTPTPA
jgi:hypothetical protein